MTQMRYQSQSALSSTGSLALNHGEGDQHGGDHRVSNCGGKIGVSDGETEPAPPWPPSTRVNKSLRSASTSASTEAPRIRSAASFGTFRPRALACRTAIRSSGTSLQESTLSMPLSLSGGTYAIAGPLGIALLYSSVPHKPYLVLNHSAPTSRLITSLAFQPPHNCSPPSGGTDSVLLAAAGGNGVMIWDASGQSLSPLITRLTCCDSWYQYHTTASASSSSSPITPNSKADQNNQATVSSWEEVTSVAWRGSKHPFLVTSTSSQISLWDLRTARNRTHRPCLRYASPFTANTGNHSTAPPSSTSHFVHVACDESSCEIAAMDKSGLVRIYDDRASSSLRGRPVAHFWAHDKGGVGIASLHQSNGAYWVTWGKDSLTFQSDNDCSVCQAKLWRDITQQNDQSDPPETVFDSDKNTVLDMEGTKSYTMLSLLGSQEVYCARVCPGPFSDAIVTVGPSTSKPCRSFESTTPATSTKMHHPDGWQAELWKIHPRHSDHAKRLGMFSAGDSDDGDLTEIFGPNHDLGSLIGAELAVGSSPFSANRSELQLCSLTSNGHLTTFGLPEADEVNLACSPPEPPTSPSGSPSPTRQTPLHHVIRPIHLSAAPLGKVFLSQANHSSNLSSDGGKNQPFNFGNVSPTKTRSDILPDSLLKVNVSFNDNSRSRPPMWSTLPSPVSPDQRPLNSSVDALGGVARGVEGAMMQFDLDASPYSGGNANVEDVNAGMLTSSALQPAPEALSSASFLGVSGRVLRKPKDMIVGEMAIETSRGSPIDAAIAACMPCPRLCGASFCGVGGLAVFHNGRVSRMWNWYRQESQRTRQTSRLADYSLASLFNEDTNTRTDTHDDGNTEGVALLGVPRTMQDLLHMASAAKIAQWGDDMEANIDSDDDESALDTSSDEDGSDLSFNEATKDTGTIDTTGAAVDETNQREESSLYHSYFNKSDYLRPDDNKFSSKKRGSESLDVNDGSKRKDDKKSHSMIGPSSDPLAPVVVCTLAYRCILLNGQCPELADGFQLGAWWFKRVGTDLLPKQTEADSRADSKPESDGWGWGYEDNVDTTPPAYGYRYLFPTSASNDSVTLNEVTSNVDKRILGFPRIHSVPAIHSMVNNKLLRDGVPDFHKTDVSLQRNQLRLLHHQGQGTLTPPDQSFSDFSVVKRALSAGEIKLSEARTPPVFCSSDALLNPQVLPMPYSMINSIRCVNDVGVYCVSSGIDDQMGQVLRTKALCLHNASVCYQVGQSEKGDVWELLGHVAETAFDGESMSERQLWKSGGFGMEVVKNFLVYYESMGDVQMLSTIVCVLGGGQDRRKVTETANRIEQEYFAPSGLKSCFPDADAKFDNYMHQYSALLYGWGKLIIRTELAKHMRSPVPGAGGETTRLIVPDSEGSNRRASQARKVVGNHGVAPGMSFAPLCGRCRRPVSDDTNVCRVCRDYAFRCAICANAVRGVFTMCLTCGHGGHLGHLVAWFEDNTVCPTGCGCTCIYNTFGRTEEEKSISDGKAFHSLRNIKYLQPQTHASGNLLSK